MYFWGAVFRFRFIACIQIQSFSGRFIFFHEYFTKAGFSWQPRSEKTLPTCFVLSARTTKFYFFMFSFMAYANLAMILTYFNSTDEEPGPKHLETELRNITRRHFFSLPVFLYWTFLYLLSLIGRHAHATTHATGT